jgi:pilus assembly protein Flp/PilA
MTTIIERFVTDQAGATAIEYGILAAMAAIALITGLLLITPLIGDGYAGVADMFPTIP